MKRGQRAFTLIELLVVISIISLLSSIVYSSLTSAREKARIAAGLQFSANLYHSTGDVNVGAWNFQEGSGTTVRDSSGSNYNGTITGASYSWSTDNPRSGGSLTLDNGTSVDLSSYTGLSNPASYGGQSTGASTVEAWIKISSYTSGSTILNGMAGLYYWQVSSENSGKLRAMARRSSANYWPVSNGAVQVDRWTHVALVLRAGVGYEYYIDGKLDKKITTADDPNVSDLLVYSYGNLPNIGAIIVGYPNSYFKGNIALVRVYGRAMGIAEVRNHYFAERSRFSDM